MRREIQRRTRRVFITVAALPLLLGVLAFWAAAAYRDRIAAVSHTQEVLHGIDDLVLQLKTAESSQRGYLLTNDRLHLGEYRAAGERTRRAIEKLRQLTSDNSTQQRYLAAITPVVLSRLARFQQAIDLHDPGTPNQRASIAVIESGIRESEKVESIARSMSDEQDHLLREEETSQAHMEASTFAAFCGGFTVCLALLFWAERLVREYGDARDNAEAGILELNRDLERNVQEVHRLNAELEQRVEMRTAELQAINEHLRRSNEDLANFAYVASHDLQEPLRMIGSYAGLLARRYEGKLDERADTYIRYVVAGAKRMQMLVHDLLTYSRAGTQEVEWKSIDAQTVFDSAVENLRKAIAESRALITHDTLPVIEGDAGKLTQVLQNLIANAIKFRKYGNPVRVHVAARLEGGDWLFTVEDNGIGFEQEYAERIFIIFQRLHEVGTYPGTGIGLAICKRIVEAHGGRIWATSQEGSGTTISFTIPARGSRSRMPSRRLSTLGTDEDNGHSRGADSVSGRQSG